ncbi:M42 family metallopeptidase [Rossellomorea vietnamensis]|uniref:M42 family metallopeptidase n=1 Tax=Rossellomorea vietnamensis TaxID=218284 RepID=A0A5D4KGY3_9BACI|nr:M42 family metallopeptidase [Rossellomorea vietnamensis]TYR75965.1 M42 family metallopeptidase [Rossellomorea vietnamensis]
MLKVIRDLTDLSGPSGFEQPITSYIKEKVQSLSDQVKVDGIGNVIASLKGNKPGPKILVTAHMDEVGFIVKKIEKNGLLRFEKIGGHDDRILLAQKVTIRSKSGPRLGIIGTISAHYQKFDTPGKIRDYRQLYIDVGASSPEEVAELGIGVSDPVTWTSSVEHLGSEQTGKIVGKAFDDRAGCAVVIKTLEDLQNREFRGEVVALFAVQEEVGLRGAKVAIANIDFDTAIAIDAAVVSDTPEDVMDDSLRLGDGAGIKVMDGSLITHPAIRDKLIGLSREKEIPYQLEIFTGIGTDAGAVTLANKDVPSGVLSIPSRNAHSPVEVIDLKDLAAVQELLVEFVKNCDVKITFTE